MPKNPAPRAQQDPQLNVPALTRNSPLALAQLLAQTRGEDLRYVPGQGRWLYWAEDGWNRDRHHTQVQAATTALLNELRAGAEQGEGFREQRARNAVTRFILRQETRGGMDGIATLASREAHMQVSAEQLDADQDLLGVPNGVVDLRNGTLRPGRREDFITRRAGIAFDPAAACPRWLSFLAQTISADAQDLDYIQKVVGYCLTGHTNVHQMWVLVGDGSNGKSTFVSTLQALVGSYGTQAAESVLLATQRADSNTNDIAALRGARLVCLTETEEGRRLNESRVKRLVAGDVVSARFLYQEYSDFAPVGKFLLATNYLPAVKGTDNGIWRRLVIVPFKNRFDDDPTLAETLRAELPGILAWAVRGAAAWHADGRRLATPEAFKREHEQYRNEQDQVGRFVAERTEANPDARISARELRDAYITWCREEDIPPLSPNEVGTRLRQLKFTKRRYGKANNHYWFGLMLKHGQTTEGQLHLAVDTPPDGDDRDAA